MCINYDGITFTEKNSTMCIENVMWFCAMRRDNLSNQQTDLIHIIYMLFCSFIYWSVVKVFLYNYCLTRLHSQTAASTSESSDRIYCYFCTSNVLYMKMIIISGFAYFSVIYSASLSGSDDLALDGNGALFANVLCKITVLHISLIRIFGSIATVMQPHQRIHVIHVDQCVCE